MVLEVVAAQVAVEVALATAAAEVLDDQPRFRTSARERAETIFDVENMVDEYLKVLLA